MDLNPYTYKTFVNSKKMTPDVAAIIIQKTWKNYKVKKNLAEVPKRFWSWFGF
jgi:hypothetical protein